MRGCSAHGRLASSVRRAEAAWTEGHLVHLPAGYPALLDGSKGRVYGELLELSGDRLLAELDGAKQVGADRATPTPPPTAKPNVRAVPLRIKLSPEAIAKLKERAQAKGTPQTAPGGRRLLVLRIRVKPAQPATPSP